MKKSVFLQMIVCVVLCSSGFAQTVNTHTSGLPGTAKLVAQWTGTSRGGGSRREVGIAQRTQGSMDDPLPAGTYTVGSGGYFPTISSAYTKLQGDGIGGPVTLELTDTLYSAAGSTGFLLYGPILGAGLGSRVTIRPTENKNVTIEGNGFALHFVNTSYLTLDGVSLTGATTLTVHALSNTQIDENGGVFFDGNSDHNVVQNITAIEDRLDRGSVGIAFSEHNTEALDGPDSNLIQNNFVKKAWDGIYVACWSSSNVLANGNIIRDNAVGSETDSLISWPINVEQSQNTLIEGNIVQSIRTPLGDNDFPQAMIFGIDLDWCDGGIVRNNIIHNVKSGSLPCIGIVVQNVGGPSSSDNLVYNNMVYDIQCNVPRSGASTTGIAVSGQTSPRIYYNSVYLSGKGNGANRNFAAALSIDQNSTDVIAENNIFVNTRDESPSLASAIFALSESNLTSDHNDLFCAENQYSYPVIIGGTDYSLPDWQAKGKDLSSITEMPNFKTPDLHIDASIPTNLESHGTPIGGIDVDLDGGMRNSNSPDIGADEFTGIIAGVNDKVIEPSRFILEQNYPNPFNPTTIIKYSIPQSGSVTLKVYDLLGREVTSLVNEQQREGAYEVQFNGNNLASGLYFYRIRAGKYTDTKKLMILR
jgi:hypothetical protein